MDEEVRRELADRFFHEAYRKQEKGELEEAAELYRKSIESFPTAEAHTFLGWALSLMGKLDEAIAECHTAISIDPTFGNPYNDIGAYLLQKGEIDEAIPWLLRALQAPRYESYCFPHTNLARAYEAKRQWSAAAEEYRKALQERPGYVPARQGLVRLRAMFN
jgi:tetratricopeptide (TPR) repeat protein